MISTCFPVCLVEFVFMYQYEKEGKLFTFNMKVFIPVHTHWFMHFADTVRVTFGMARFHRTVILLITKIQHTHRVFIDRGNI